MKLHNPKIAQRGEWHPAGNDTFRRCLVCGVINCTDPKHDIDIEDDND